MTADRETWFKELEPPAGGAERLRLRLEEPGRPAGILPARVAIVGAGAAALALAIALFTLRNDDGSRPEAVADLYQAAAFDRLLGRPLERTELNVVVDAKPVRVSRVGSADPKIRIYRVD